MAELVQLLQSSPSTPSLDGENEIMQFLTLGNVVHKGSCGVQSCSVLVRGDGHSTARGTSYGQVPLDLFLYPVPFLFEVLRYMVEEKHPCPFSFNKWELLNLTVVLKQWFEPC